MITIDTATSPGQIDQARALFIEYGESLGFDLCFQDYDTELKNLPGEYAPPDGQLLLAYFNNEPVGCVALRKFGESTCEMKRLYVRPPFRGLGIGRRLAEDIIDGARQRGYRIMRLDTIATMFEAINLYKSLGFQERDSYRFNPLEDARYFELTLF